jgi:hypothetical protein
MQSYLEETDFLDFNHTNFTNFLKNHNEKGNTVEQAVSLYEYVRDYFLYDPYHLDLRKNALTASNIVQKKRAWCVEKSIVLCACFRKYKIPARLGFAVVTNHIGVEKLTSYLKRPEIVFHGFVEVFLNDNWVKCTPAFDKRICHFNQVEVLHWDGKNDSLFQEFVKGQKYMTYDHFYGVFEDVPMELMNLEMKKYYPHLFENNYDSREFSFYHNL